MGDLRKVGDRVAPRPNMMESARIAAYSAGALTLAFAAVAGNTGSQSANMRTLGLLGAAGVVAACATRDAVKPDDEEEARAAQQILETEAAELRAEAIDAWKNSNLMAFIRGERPSDEWVSAWVRQNFAEETLALPQASEQEFVPQEYSRGFGSAIQPEYEPAPQMAAQNFSPEPMVFPTTRHTPEPIRQTTLVQAPEFKRPAAVSSKAGNGEFSLDEIANFRCLVWVKGAKGSGKTSKVTHIEKCRHDLGHAVWRIDPMPPQADLHRRRGIALYGKQENWAEIEFAVSEFNKLAKERLERRGQDPNYSPETEQHVNLSMDEGAVLCQIDKGVLEEFWLHTVVRRIRQANMSVTIGTHGETKRFLGMTNDDCFTGLIDALKEDAILVQGHTLDSRIPQSFADITYQGRTWRVDCSHVLPHEEVEFPSLSTPSAPQPQPHELQLLPVRTTPIASSGMLALPEVTTTSDPRIPTVQTKVPSIEDLLTKPEFLHFRVMIAAAAKNNRTISARSIRQKAPSNKALRHPNGEEFGTDFIKNCISHLATNYPELFGAEDVPGEGFSLVITNAPLLNRHLEAIP